jgi:hypothetical protein
MHTDSKKHFVPTDANNVLAGRCSTCKHWVDNYYVLQEYSDRHKMCNVATEDDSGSFMDAICSGEGIGGELITRDDFGCVLHNDR